MNTTISKSLDARLRKYSMCGRFFTLTVYSTPLNVTWTRHHRETDWVSETCTASEFQVHQAYRKLHVWILDFVHAAVYEGLVQVQDLSNQDVRH